MEDEEEIPVDINNDLERRLAEAFTVFDHAANRRIDLQDLSSVVRGIGCCPAEADLRRMAAAMEDADVPGTIHLSRFLPHVSQLIFEHKFQPPSAERILEAFRTLDGQGHGFLTREEVTAFMAQPGLGEPFSHDELEEMLELAVDPHTGTIPYEYYVNQLTHEPDGEDDVYRLADRIEAEKPPPPPPPRRMSEYLRETAGLMA